MAVTLSASVGIRGSNISTDVKMVQELLTAKGYRLGSIDGICGAQTVSAIMLFQANFLKKPDGLISKNGKTWGFLIGEGFLSSTMKTKDQPVTKGTAKRTWTKLKEIPPKNTLNQGLTAASNAFLISKFGMPRADMSQDCQPVTNVDFKKKISTGKIGNFKATGITELVTSLQQVFQEIARQYPELYPEIGTAGMLCCRYQRNSTTKISNHSWGSAIDLTVSGSLDSRGDGYVQEGLLLIAPIFNNYGWYWGASFTIEDSMHFEAGKDLISTIS